MNNEQLSVTCVFLLCVIILLLLFIFFRPVHHDCHVDFIALENKVFNMTIPYLSDGLTIAQARQLYLLYKNHPAFKYFVETQVNEVIVCGKGNIVR